jgi:pimeloyl-ACP methyl ester carboxylesterase
MKPAPPVTIARTGASYVRVQRRRLVVTAADGVELVGELVTPNGVHAVSAALILSGSGPLDRDSNMPRQKLDIANALASTLAAHGIASLRYDKRGVGESGGDHLRTGFDEETDDADAALRTLRATPGIDPGHVLVIGHSLGADIAIRLAVRHEWLAGIVLLSASCRSGLAVMEWQSERIAGTFRGVQRLLRRPFLWNQARTRRRLLSSSGDVLRVTFVKQPARWFREIMAYDPSRDLQAVRCPVLAITGRDDIQVDPDDVARIGELVAGPFTGETPDGLTHLLRVHAGPPSLSSYGAQMKELVDAALLERVAAWARSDSARRPP